MNEMPTYSSADGEHCSCYDDYVPCCDCGNVKPSPDAQLAALRDERDRAVRAAAEKATEIAENLFHEWWSEKEAEGAPNGFYGELLYQLGEIK